MKKLFLYLILLLSFQISSQEKNKAYTFGNVSMEDLKMSVYEKDTTANAVVIYEHGNTIIKNKTDNLYNNIFLKTTVYKKIKIFNKDAEKHATVKIFIYNDKNKNTEKVKNIKAITYNLNEPKTHLNPKHIYTTVINKSLKEVTFTFPNVKPGSILEYQYDLESKFFFNFSGWVFQSDIPKIYSEFHALIPGNWQYNRSLKGMLKLAINKAEIKKNCFSIGFEFFADCEDLTYAMKDVPAFIEEEKYSTTKNNYISKIKFELAKITHADGSSKKFTTSWKETDKRLKYDESIGKQLKNKTFFSKNLPNELLTIDDKLSQCKSIYKYIQNHFSLNEDKTSIFREVDVKKAYKETLGSVSEINLALISALKAVDIDAKIILLATRDKGFPTKVHPIITDFNYSAAHVTINNQIYLLDASDKYLPFNMLPFKALNSYGRVLDFENGSYWHDIEPSINTFQRIGLELDITDSIINGKLKIIDNGYFASNKRKKINDKSKEDYILEVENESTNLIINNYKNSNVNDLEQQLVEEFQIEFEDIDIENSIIYFNPFISKIKTNPFQLNERTYPVDFGYNRKYTFVARINVSKNYIIKSIPEKIILKLPNKGGSFVCNTTVKDNQINIYSQYTLKKSKYIPLEYLYLKEFFNQIIKTQNSLITLEKISN